MLINCAPRSKLDLHYPDLKGDVHDRHEVDKMRYDKGENVRDLNVGEALFFKATSENIVATSKLLYAAPSPSRSTFKSKIVWNITKRRSFVDAFLTSISRLKEKITRDI